MNYKSDAAESVLKLNGETLRRKKDGARFRLSSFDLELKFGYWTAILIPLGSDSRTHWKSVEKIMREYTVEVRP